MSNLATDSDSERCRCRAHATPAPELLEARAAEIGPGMVVRRVIPHRQQRLVGPWCFLDHFGPVSLEPPGMRIGPHPHTGLQTVTWLLEGEMLHRDSLGYEQLIRPGQLNVMTAGHGIAHSEESPDKAGGAMHGLQLWVALPDAERHRESAFEHHAALPVVHEAGMSATVVMGEALGERSPATAYSPIVGVDLALDDTGGRELTLEHDFEHALVVAEGTVLVEGFEVTPGKLCYLGTGRERLHLACDAPARVMLVGGAPFGEDILIWWNFVARTAEEIAEARADWAAGRRFGRVEGYDGAPLVAPEFSGRPRAGGGSS